MPFLRINIHLFIGIKSRSILSKEKKIDKEPLISETEEFNDHSFVTGNDHNIEIEHNKENVLSDQMYDEEEVENPEFINFENDYDLNMDDSDLIDPNFDALSRFCLENIKIAGILLFL